MTAEREPQGYGTVPDASTSRVSSTTRRPVDDAVNSLPAPRETRPRTTRWVPIVMMLTILGIDSLGWVMCLAPQTQLFEDIACRKYYSLANRAHVLDAGGKDL